MSLKPYPEYKDSGFDWLGSLPSSWKALRLKFGFDLQKRPISSDMEIVTAFRDGEVTLRKNRRLEGYTEGDKQIGYQGIEPGDLVIHAMDAFAGAIGVSDSRGKSTPVYNVCRPKPGVQARFFAFALRHLALTGYIESLSKGIRERSTDFRWADAKNVIVPFPPQSEQHEIVAFLDDELSDIDAFIADQEELITLLAERRTATVTRAVTKGLDTDAPMKESGIEWLGDIPAAWSVIKLGWAARCSSGLSISNGDFELTTSEDLVIPVIGGNGVTGYTNVSNIDTYRIVIGRVGALCGNVHLVQEPAWVTDNALRLILDEKFFDKDYLVLLLRARKLNDLADKTAQPLITGSLVTAQRLPHPPIEVQRSIASYVRHETAEIDAAIADAREAITLSKERRAAVISAAVTGKIDVRGLVAPATNNVEAESVGIA
ncbi:restriction endonuclease subunit S [Glutamicibacter arilaitensis]|uniref:restriction endonuclease subunit S n=1 Tax=Glutamicibacter arilaitensis TaxID=256701 RepID=UPI003FD33E5F